VQATGHPTGAVTRRVVVTVRGKVAVTAGAVTGRVTTRAEHPLGAGLHPIAGQSMMTGTSRVAVTAVTVVMGVAAATAVTAAASAAATAGAVTAGPAVTTVTDVTGTGTVTGTGMAVTAVTAAPGTDLLQMHLQHVAIGHLLPSMLQTGLRPQPGRAQAGGTRFSPPATRGWSRWLLGS